MNGHYRYCELLCSVYDGIAMRAGCHAERHRRARCQRRCLQSRLRTLCDEWELRLYALPDSDEIEVDVRYLRQTREREQLTIVLVRQDRVHLRIPAPRLGLRVHPAMAEVCDLQNLPELATLGAFWIEIVPVTAGARMRAFASITNHDTQQFTLVTPQR